jgi:hypothetical protein
MVRCLFFFGCWRTHPPCFSYECEGEGVTGKGVRKMLILKGRFGGLTACRSKRARFA